MLKYIAHGETKSSFQKILEFRANEFLEAKNRPAYIRKYKNASFLKKMAMYLVKIVKTYNDANDLNLILNRIIYLSKDCAHNEFWLQMEVNKAATDLFYAEAKDQLAAYWAVWTEHRENLLAEGLIDRPDFHEGERYTISGKHCAKICNSLNYYTHGKLIVEAHRSPDFRFWDFKFENELLFRIPTERTPSAALKTISIIREFKLK